MIKYPHVRVQMTGEDGNVFFVLGRCHKAAEKAGLTEDEFKAFLDECMSGDYEHLLATCTRWFHCE